MLTNEDLQQILNDWSTGTLQSGQSIPRSLREQCLITSDVVTVIQGVRRCGKSTLLRQLMISNQIPRDQTVFINFEDPRLVNDLNHQLLEQLYQHSSAQTGKMMTFFFDEIQNVSYWQKWLNAKLESREGHRFIITGSNSQLLGGELATSLTGRHLRLELFPFDFPEFKQAIQGASLLDFIEQGGFPAALNFPEPQKLLQQYFLGIVEKDIRERVAAKSSRPLQAVAKMVMESVGSELSLRRIAGAVQLSPDTVSHYLQACEDAYLILAVRSLLFPRRKEHGTTANFTRSTQD